MQYTKTPGGYDVSFEFSGETFPVGYIRINLAIEEVYSYTDTLFGEPTLIFRHCYLSDLQDNISDYYSSRDSIHAIEQRWR